MIFWITALPLLLAAIWLVTVFLGLMVILPAREMRLLAALMLALCLTIPLLWFHYRHYVEHPPRHRNWLFFIAAEETLRSDLHIAWIDSHYQLQFWGPLLVIQALIDAVRRWFKGARG